MRAYLSHGTRFGPFLSLSLSQKAKFHRQTDSQTDRKQTDAHDYYTSLTLHAHEVTDVEVVCVYGV